MANSKRTFIFYSDWINMIREMPNEHAGELLKHILSYVNDEEPETDNLFVKMAFGHMKPMLKADLDKWEGIRGKRKEAGKKGGQANAKQKVANAKQVEAVNVNVNDNVIVNDNIPLKKVTKFSFKESLINYGFKKELVEDWLKVRKTKKATNTETSYKAFILEIEQRPCNINEVLTHIIEKSWSGFKWSWIDNEKQKQHGTKKGLVAFAAEQLKNDPEYRNL